MHLPYLQLSQQAFSAARIVGGLLGITRREALGMLCDLWAWAVERANGDEPPSGEVRGPRAVLVLAAALEWTGPGRDPEALLAALEDAGLVQRLHDGLRIRGLDRYRALFDGRARDRERKRRSPLVDGDRRPPKAARPPRTETQTSGGIPPESTRKGKEKLQAYAGAEAPEVQLQNLWNELAAPELPRWKGMSSSRRRQAHARLKERPLDAWPEVIRRISASDFCRGLKGNNGWRASPDWLLRPDTADKVLEGKYDNADRAFATEEPAPPARPPETPAGRLWASATEQLRTTGRTYAVAWLGQLQPRQLEAGHLVLQAPDPYMRDWARANYGELLDEVLGGLGLTWAIEGPAPPAEAAAA